MKKIFVSLILVVLLAAALVTPALAYEYGSVYDASNLFPQSILQTPGEFRLPGISDTYDIDLKVDLVLNTEGYSLAEYAQLWANKYGYGSEGDDYVSLMVLAEYTDDSETDLNYVGRTLIFAGRGEEIFLSNDKEGGHYLLELLDPHLTAQAWTGDARQDGKAFESAIEAFADCVEYALYATENGANPFPSAPVTTLNRTLINDWAGKLTASQEQTLEALVTAAAEKYHVEIGLIIVDDMGGGDARERTKDYYRTLDIGYGAEKSGVFLMLSLAERDYYVVSYGHGSVSFTDYGREKVLIPAFLPYFKENDFYGGFRAYVMKAIEILQYEAENGPMDTGNKPFDSSPSGIVSLIVIILVGPLLGAWGFCAMSMRGMKTAVKQRNASAYIARGSLVIANGEEEYTHSTETRTYSPPSSSSSGSSSDSSGFSGSGGKF